MSIRATILAALHKNGAQTYDDLELSTQIERSQLRIAVNDAKKAGHVAMGRDDVTHQPAYKITPEGIKWLKANSGQKSNSEKQVHEQPKPGVGVNNPGSRQSVPPVGQASTPAEVASDNGNAGAGHDAPAGSAEFKFALGMIRKALGIDHDDSIGIVPTIEALIESEHNWRTSCDGWHQRASNTQQALMASVERSDNLQSELKAWQQASSAFGIATPQELLNGIADRNQRIAALEDEIAYLTDDSGQESESTAASPIGFVVHAPKRKPRLCLKYERAMEAAQTAARVAGSAKVLALTHVGTARRKKAVTVEYATVQQEAGHE